MSFSFPALLSGIILLIAIAVGWLIVRWFTHLPEVIIPNKAWQCSTQAIPHAGGYLRNTFAYIEFETPATRVELQGATTLGSIGYAHLASFGVFVGTAATIGDAATFTQNALLGGKPAEAPTPHWVALTGVNSAGTKRIRVMVPAQCRGGLGTQELIGVVLLKLRANGPITFIDAPAYSEELFVGEDSIAAANPANSWVEAWPLLLRQLLKGKVRVVVNSIAGASLVEVYGTPPAPYSANVPDKVFYRSQFEGAAEGTNVYIYGANDGGRFTPPVSAAAFGETYSNLLDDMHAQYPKRKQAIVTPFTTGDLEPQLAPLRAVVGKVVASRPWALKIDGPPAFTGVPGPSKPGDPDDKSRLHPGTSQHAETAQYMLSQLQLGY